MRICVFGAASNKIDVKYIDDCYSLAKTLASRGHKLVFGAGGEGLMGAVARGFKEKGAFVHGVIPKFFEENGYEAVFRAADKITYTETMAERKTTMENDCDAFLIVPGGIGTFEEFFEVLTLKQLGRHKKAIVVYNSFGYYDGLDKIFEKIIAAKFVNEECRRLFATLCTHAETVDYLKNYSAGDVRWELLKRN